MRRNQIPSAAEREQLLAGGRVEGNALSELLGAATMPIHSAEPPGLDSALAAFRSAPAPVAAQTARRTPVLKSLLSGLVATKVIAGVAGAAAVGGVALAASTGHLGDGGNSADAPGQAIASAHRADAAASPADAASESTRASGASSDSSSASSPAHAPTPSLAGLCHAWQAHERSNSDHTTRAAHSAWAKSPAFSVLIATAGGNEGVDAYCSVALAPTTSGSGSPTHVAPTHPTHPTHPTQAVTTHPNHKPTSVPSHSHPAPTHTNHKPTPTPSESSPAA
jgi:hypothetical protein